jgi:hypothetical protein
LALVGWKRTLHVGHVRCGLYLYLLRRLRRSRCAHRFEQAMWILPAKNRLRLCSLISIGTPQHSQTALRVLRVCSSMVTQALHTGTVSPRATTMPLSNLAHDVLLNHEPDRTRLEQLAASGAVVSLLRVNHPLRIPDTSRTINYP